MSTWLSWINFCLPCHLPSKSFGRTSEASRASARSPNMIYHIVFIDVLQIRRLPKIVANMVNFHQ